MAPKSSTSKSISRLIADLETEGLSIWCSDGRICYRGDPRLTNSDGFSELARRKQEALDHFATHDNGLELPALVTANPRPGRIPLSLAQQRIYYLGYRAQQANHRFSMEVPVGENVSADLIHTVLQDIATRHESLRTIYRDTGLQVEQVVLTSPSLTFEVVDLSGCPPTEIQRRLRSEYIVPFRDRPVDLAVGPIIGAQLLLLPQGRLLSLALNRIAVDYMSQQLLLAGFITRCQAALAGRSMSLPPLGIQYADYALWEDSWLGACRFNHWETRLRALEPVSLAAPTSQPPYHRRRTPIQFSREQSLAIRSYALQCAVSVDVILAAGCMALLSRWLQRSRFAIGWLTNARPPGCEALIGAFANPRPLLTEISPSTRFEELLLAMRSSAMEASDFRRPISTDLSRRFNLHRILLNVVTVMTRPLAAAPTVNAGEKNAELLDAVGPPDFFGHLVITLGQSSAGIGGLIDFAQDVVDSDAVLWFADKLPEVLERSCKAPSETLDHLIGTREFASANQNE
jgi:hypothetical protein